MAPIWHRTARLLIPVVSIVFGSFLLIFSCIYSFRVVGIHTKFFSETFIKPCRNLPERASTDAKLICTVLNQEMAAGIIGLIFGFFQVCIGAAMLVTKDKPDLCKIWAVANSILLAFILAVGVIPLHIYDLSPCLSKGGGGYGSYYQRNAQTDSVGKQALQNECEPTHIFKNGETICVRHLACPQIPTGDGNGIIITFGIIGILDTIFLFASVVITAVICQAASDPRGSTGKVEPLPENQTQMSRSQAGQNSQVVRGSPGPYQNQPTPDYKIQPKHYSLMLPGKLAE